MILVTSPFNWHHAVTLTFDLPQGQICCRTGDDIFRSCLFLSHYDHDLTVVFTGRFSRTWWCLSLLCYIMTFELTFIYREIFPYLVVFVGLENVLVITKSVVSTPVDLEVKYRIAQGKQLTESCQVRDLKLIVSPLLKYV